MKEQTRENIYCFCQYLEDLVIQNGGELIHNESFYLTDHLVHKPKNCVRFKTSMMYYVLMIDDTNQFSPWLYVKTPVNELTNHDVIQTPFYTEYPTRERYEHQLFFSERMTETELKMMAKDTYKWLTLEASQTKTSPLDGYQYLIPLMLNTVASFTRGA